jgi:hypothetical protein
MSPSSHIKIWQQVRQVRQLRQVSVIRNKPISFFIFQNMYIVDSGKLNVFRTSEDLTGQMATCLLKQVGQVVRQKERQKD